MDYALPTREKRSALPTARWQCNSDILMILRSSRVISLLWSIGIFNITVAEALWSRPIIVLFLYWNRSLPGGILKCLQALSGKYFLIPGDKRSTHSRCPVSVCETASHSCMSICTLPYRSKTLYFWWKSFKKKKKKNFSFKMTHLVSRAGPDLSSPGSHPDLR